MRYRSILALLVVAIASFGLVGCGSSGNDSQFVATGNPDGPPTTGGLTFNFITAQSPFVVDANTNTLRFDFFDGLQAESILTVTREFAQSITIENVPATVRSVLITGFDGNGFPLFTINQTVSVTAGSTTTVEGINGAVPVTLTDLRLAPGNIFDLDSELTQVDVQVGGATQVFLFAEYSNGSIVLLGEDATYSIALDSIATVSSQATVSGISAGTATLLAQFGGQTLSRPVIVSDGFTQTLSDITVTNAQPIMVGTEPVQITTVGTRASDSQQFGLSPSSLGYDAGPDFTVSADGMLSVNGGVVSGTMGTLTVTWLNPGNVPVTTTASIQAQ